MSSSGLTEQETRTRLINPALDAAGWSLGTQVREDFGLTPGRIVVRGRLHTRQRPKRADYVLFFKPGIPLAVVEAKDAQTSPGIGMPQALTYAQMLDAPFAISTNGHEYLLHDRTGLPGGQVEVRLQPNELPSPTELWDRYLQWKGLVGEASSAASVDFFSSDRKDLRYYQSLAVRRAVEAIATGRKRLLLVMATGSGKTLTAFQIIWRLRKAGLAKRVLFLVDRNVLADQTLINDFAPLGSVVTKVTKRTVDKSYEVYVALYQAVTGADEDQDIFTEFSPDFFDLVIVDECHRGSAAEDSSWRRVLDYFQSAVQIGLTATPKETTSISNIDYFGEPVFVYSLKDGIEDGFLAPFKVTRLDLDRDVSGWRPEAGQRDRYGAEVPDRVYRGKDFDRTVVLEQRTELVASAITEFLKEHGRMSKTIVFCEDIDHAERMRQALVNHNADMISVNERYVARITGDSPYGQRDLDDFMSPETEFPVIVTTSRLLRTGVDAQTCKVIVLDQNIDSATEFKQIVGRGTRVREDFDKFFFDILDFRGATDLFADPDFDGPPVQVLGEIEDSNTPEEVGVPGESVPEGHERREKYYVDGVSVEIANRRVQYFDSNGRLITESLSDYTRRSVGKEFDSLDTFLSRWSTAQRKSAVVSELAEHGVIFEALAEQVGAEYDPFDLICHVAFGRRPITRRQRAERVRTSNYLGKFGPVARAVIDALLDKYADVGSAPLEELGTLSLQPISDIGTPVEILGAFGGRSEYLAVLRELEAMIYETA